MGAVCVRHAEHGRVSKQHVARQRCKPVTRQRSNPDSLKKYRILNVRNTYWINRKCWIEKIDNFGQEVGSSAWGDQLIWLGLVLFVWFSHRIPLNCSLIDGRFLWTAPFFAYEWNNDHSQLKWFTHRRFAVVGTAAGSAINPRAEFH